MVESDVCFDQQPIHAGDSILFVRQLFLIGNNETRETQVLLFLLYVKCLQQVQKQQAKNNPSLLWELISSIQLNAALLTVKQLYMWK